MTYKEAIITIVGSGVFTFLVIMCWGKFVEYIGVIGGFLAALVIPGTMWVLNHGIEHSLITQSGSVWIDMAMAVGIGVLVSSKIQGGRIRKAKSTFGALLVATLISGYILTII